jgi:hypothetical protein
MQKYTRYGKHNLLRQAAIEPLIYRQLKLMDTHMPLLVAIPRQIPTYHDKTNCPMMTMKQWKLVA